MSALKWNQKAIILMSFIGLRAGHVHITQKLLRCLLLIPLLHRLYEWVCDVCVCVSAFRSPFSTVGLLLFHFVRSFRSARSLISFVFVCSKINQESISSLTEPECLRLTCKKSIREVIYMVQMYFVDMHIL